MYTAERVTVMREPSYLLIPWFIERKKQLGCFASFSECSRESQRTRDFGILPCLCLECLKKSFEHKHGTVYDAFGRGSHGHVNDDRYSVITKLRTAFITAMSKKTKPQKKLRWVKEREIILAWIASIHGRTLGGGRFYAASSVLSLEISEVNLSHRSTSHSCFIRRTPCTEGSTACTELRANV